jgi:hypothetical protein
METEGVFVLKAVSVLSRVHGIALLICDLFDTFISPASGQIAH